MNTNYFPLAAVVVDDETGEWVTAHSITRVIRTNSGAGSIVFTLQDTTDDETRVYSCWMRSPLSPEELRERFEEAVRSASRWGPGAERTIETK